MIEATPTERLLRRDRRIVIGGLVAITLLAWIYLMTGAGTGMDILAMTSWRFPSSAEMADGSMAMPWSATYGLLMVLMWWIMMIAMMVPSAAPMILLYARVNRHAQKQGRMEPSAIPTAAFAMGYLLAWLAFSLAAAGLQWGLEQAGLLSAMMMWSTDTILSGSILAAAGIYQLTPLKDVCLSQCRAPADFLSRHWRKGRSGALRMGVEHGLYCIGCCWFLMALLFAGGVMNLLWIAGLAALVLVEKLTRHGRAVSRVTGVLLIGAGVWLIADLGF